MTTTVTVKALHGWPVQVTEVHRPPHGPIIRHEHIVDKNETRDFNVHSFNDLEIHEIQPDPRDDEG